MLGSSSPEFIALCQSQVLLLTQALGASSTVVYLAEQATDLVNPNLVPVVAYPDNAVIWASLENALSTIEQGLPSIADQAGGLLLSGQDDGSQPGAKAFDAFEAGAGELEFDAVDSLFSHPGSPSPNDEVEANAAAAQPLILPLAHEGVVLGVMVSTREALPWNREDYQQAERVANTLAIACVMDQRDQWLQLQLRQRQLSQADQSRTFHDLLHQFRNPLTALHTFGKLMLKRMQAGDPNQFIAEGIVRETGRLQDLTQTFDAAVARGDEDFNQSVTPVPLRRLLLPGAEDRVEPQGGGSTEGQGGAFSGSQTWSHDAGSGQGHNFHGLGRDLTIAAGTIGAVAEPLLLSAAAIAQDRDRILVQDIPPDLPDVWMDGGALREVLSNLLDNALKYAGKGAVIWVTGGLVQGLDDHLYQGIAIGDTGPGIPLQDQAHIFKRHYRGVQAEGETPGTGLGLAIVAELVEAMGGHIDLISPVQLDHWLPEATRPRASGPGSLFIVWLKTV